MKTKLFLTIVLILGLTFPAWATVPESAYSWPNGFGYTPSQTTEGTTNWTATNQSQGRIDAKLGSLATIGDPLYPTFAAAVATLNSAGTACTLRLPVGTHTVAADLTINSNINLLPDKGAVITIATTKILTINGTLDAGLYQIFSCTGTGKVVFGAGAVKEVYPEWWAANTTPSSTDMTAAFQAAVTAATTSNLWGKVSLLPTTYKLTSNVSALSGFTLEGVAPGGANVGTTDKGGGTWLYYAHAGKGFSFLSTNGAYSDAYVKNLGTYRDQPAPAGGWAPTAHDYDFYLDGSPGITFDNVILFNPTKGVWVGGNSGRANFYNVRGQPLEKGIVVDVAMAVCRFDQIHFWPYWSIDANVKAYTKANLDAIQLIRCDNPQMSNIFTIWAKSGLRLSKNASGATSRIHAVNLDFDEGLYGLWVDNTVTAGVTGQFANFSHLGGTTGSMGVFVEGNNALLNFSLCKLNQDDLNAIHVNGTGNQLYFNGLEATYYDQSATNVPAIDVATGNIVTISPRPLIAGGGGTGGSYANTGTIYVDDWRTYTPTITSGTGTITTVGAVVGNYKLVGTTVQVVVDVTITTNGTGASDIRVTLPFGTAATSSIGRGKEVAATGKSLGVWINTGATLALVTDYANAYPAGNGYRLILTFDYLI